MVVTLQLRERRGVREGKMVVVDPERTQAQAEALLATRRILARMELELLERGEELAKELTDEDWEVLEHDTEWRADDDLRVFAQWHAALGTATPRRRSARCAGGSAGEHRAVDKEASARGVHQIAHHATTRQDLTGPAGSRL